MNTIKQMAAAGGRARAAKLTQERRKEIATKASRARWSKYKEKTLGEVGKE